VALPVWINNLIAYSLQIAILTAAGTLLAYLFRLRMPSVTLVYWQSLLVGCLFVFALQEWRHPVFIPMAATAGPTVSVSLPAAALPAISQPSFRFEPEWIGWILAAGIFLRLIWLALGLLRLRFFRRNARRLLEKSDLIEEIQSRTQARASVWFSDQIDSPVTFGIRRPDIILPDKFNNMNEDWRKAVLCHELLHIRRRDWLFVIFEEAVRSFFWFHPAIWWLLGRIRLSREQAVDYDVVRLSGDRQPYLDSLLEFARAQGRPRAVPAPLFLKERHLVQRVALLLQEASMSRSRLFVSLTAISILLIGTVRLAAGWFPLTGEPVIMRAQIPSPMPTELSPPATVEKPVPSKLIQAKAPRISSAAARDKRVIVAENAIPTLPAVPPLPVQEPVVPPRAPIKVGGNVQESKLIYKVEPVYPELAKNARITGTVIMVVTANEEGLVTDIKVNSGHPLLTEAAIAAVKQWRYSPTLLNGMPVPVVFTVTCIFNFMGENDVSAAIDEAGNLVAMGQSDIEGLMPKLVQGGTAFIRIATRTPIQVAERVVQSLLKRGVQRIQLNGPFALYQGKLFYTGTPAKPPQFIPDIVKLRALLGASPRQTEPGVFNMLIYYIYINEAGEILGVQCIAGPNNPEIDRELMQTPVFSPALLESEPVPFMYAFRMAM
jgi:TonB family protein